MSKKLAKGTKIKFNQELIEDACGDHPAFLLANEDSLGEIISVNPRNSVWNYEVCNECKETFYVTEKEIRIV